MNTTLAKTCTRRWLRNIPAAALALLITAGCVARADVVTEWNKNAEKAILSSSIGGN